ncbi:MAG: hypothetical protein ACK4XJ_05035 [Fimbriimonadaceae bacterium]
MNLLAIAATVIAPQTFAPKIGIELDGLGDGNRGRPFIDLAKTMRPWQAVVGDRLVTVDELGWPTQDAATVFFDIRPTMAWAPPIDDPDGFQPDWSGTYHLSFTGQADLRLGEGNGPRFEDVAFDRASNRTTAKIVVPKGTGLLFVQFVNTKRTPDSPSGTGIRDVRLTRPGYDHATKETFTREYLNSLKPFSTLRFMDWLETNHQPGFYGDPGNNALHWRNRRPANYATQATGERGPYGVAWEYVVELANKTKKDVWINLPVAATDDYMRELARFMKRELDPGLRIYLEHSNEVWNYGFPQYIYNKLAAVDEVNHGRSNLNNDGSKDEETWARRRHARRTVDLAKVFMEEFGEKTPQGRVRPVYCSWVIYPDVYYREVLKWVESTYGAPKDYFYGIAGASYYNAHSASPTASVEEILAAMRKSSDESFTQYRRPIQAIADQYGVKHLQYEIGPDNGGGDPTNVANRIRANRDPRMKDLILHDARNNWFPMGGDLYMYFAHIGAYSRYGCWGLSEDVDHLHTPKWQAIYELTGSRPAATNPK